MQMAPMTAIAAFLVIQGPLSHRVVLVSERPKSELERSFLSRPPELWQVEAQKSGYVSEEHQGFTFVWHRSTMRMDEKERAIQVAGAMQDLLQAGKRTVALGALPKQEREAIADVLRRSFVGREAGPAIDRPTTSVTFDWVLKVKLTDGKTSLDLRIPQSNTKLSDSFFAAKPTAAEWQSYERAHKDLTETEGSSQSLAFHFGIESLTSMERTTAVAVCSARLLELVKALDTKLQGAREALESALLSESKPSIIEDALLGEVAAKQVLRAFGGDASAYGFSGSEEFGSYLKRARVSAVGFQVLVGIGVINATGQKELKSATVSLGKGN